MMKKVLLGALCFSVMAPFGFSKAGTTGFYVGANVGGMYTNSLKEYARHNSQDSDSQTELFELSKNFGFVVGLHVGYGYEFKNGFYIGANVYGNYDFTKIEHDDDDAEGIVTRNMVYNSDANANTDITYRIDELKPMFGYGFAIQAGYKVCPNILAYVSFGVEGTYTKAKQVIAGETEFLIQNDYGAGFKFKSTEAGTGNSNEYTCNSNGGDELSTNLVNIVPALGMKYFFGNGTYVGGEVRFLIGFSKEIDSEDVSASYAMTRDDGKVVNSNSLTSRGSKLYMARKFAVGYQLTAGYKF